MKHNWIETKLECTDGSPVYFCNGCGTYVGKFLSLGGNYLMYEMYEVEFIKHGFYAGLYDPRIQTPAVDEDCSMLLIRNILSA